MPYESVEPSSETQNAPLKAETRALLRASQDPTATPKGNRRNLAFTAPPGFIEPLDLHTCYTPWPVFRDVTDGAGLFTTLPGAAAELTVCVRQTAWYDQPPEGGKPDTRTDQKTARRTRIIPELAWIRRPTRDLVCPPAKITLPRFQCGRHESQSPERACG